MSDVRIAPLKGGYGSSVDPCPGTSVLYMGLWNGAPKMFEKRFQSQPCCFDFAD